MLLSFFSCKRDATIIVNPGTPVPEETTSMRSFRIVFGNLPENLTLSDGFRATLALTNNETPNTEFLITIPIQKIQQYGTTAISLKKGNYTLKRLVLSNAAGIIRYASPIAGAAKAALVSKPLSLTIPLSEKVEKIISAEILAILNTDTAENFGYPAGSFGNHNPNTPQEEMDKRIFIRPLIKVGDIIYDSIPVQLVVKSWNAKNEMTYNIHYLPAGTQSLYLSAKAVKHQLTISRWGIHDELLLQKNEIQENTVYDMGGSKAAKKPITVYEYKIMNGVSVPITKTNFEYNTNGQLKQTVVFAKHPDKTNYIIQKNSFEYTNNKITHIKTYNENYELEKTLMAQYNTEGRVAYMEEKRGVLFTKAFVYYIPLETQSGISQHFRVDIEYTHEHGLYKTYYNKQVHGGVIIKDQKSTGNGNTQEGLYQYDSNINPYAHLNIPDLTLSSLATHNATNSWKTWYGAYPEFEAYKFDFKYDADGYLIEQLITYRSYRTKIETHTSKTVFVF